MEDFLHYIITGLVDHPKDVKIKMEESEYGMLLVEVEVNEEDMGKVIGKNGKVINAIRKLAKVRAIKLGKRLQLNLIDPKGSQKDPKEQ